MPRRNSAGVPLQLKHYKAHIEDFLRRHMNLIDSNTRGLVRLWEEMELLDSKTADKLCQLDVQGKILRPETYVRVRRELIAADVLPITPEQKSLLEASEAEIRGYYRREL